MLPSATIDGSHVRVGSKVQVFVGVFNGSVVALTRAPLVGRLMGRSLVEISYVGRRSGRTFSTPVEYRRTGDVVTIGVQFPDLKNWWRNVLDDGGPITLHLDGGDRTGHATARRDGPRRATVTVHLDPT
jgi:hypothetical protein